MKNKKKNPKKESNELFYIFLILFLLLLIFYLKPSITGFTILTHTSSSEWTGTHVQTNSSIPITSIILDNDTLNTYFTYGNYTSKAIDASFNTQWNELNWSNTTDYGEIKFQVKSCDDSNCDTEIFVGPDNTSSTYFTENATLNETLTPNNQYFQYIAHLSTTDTSFTPYLESVEINYNSFPLDPVIIINSTSEEQLNYTNETIACNFLCSDSVADTLTYDLYWYLNGVYNLSFISQSCDNPSYNSPILRDDNTTKNDLWSCSLNTTDNGGLSSNTIFSNNVTINNYIPITPILNLPNNDTSFNVIPELNWNNVSDFDIDLDSYTYYLEIDNNSDFLSPEYVNSSISETANTTRDTPTGLSDATYYWRVLSNDGIDNSSWSETREFLFDSTPPLEFNLLSPTNGNSSTDNTPLLTWESPTELNFDNYTIEISNASDFSTINSTYNTTTNSFSEWSYTLSLGTWYWRVTAYDKANNFKTCNEYFSYTVQETIAPSTTVTSETTSAGGTSIKPYTINIITPEGVTIYSNDTLIIPLIVTNPTDINLRTILLNVSSNETDVTPSLDLTNIPSLRPKEQRKINLKIVTHTEPGTYGIIISAIVTQPYFVDTFRIYANLIERDFKTKNEVNKQLDFAKKLFSGNPQCLDLSEFIKQSESALQLGKYDQALNLAKNAIEGCNKLLALQGIQPASKKLPFSLEKYLSLENLKKKTTIIIISEILGLLLITVIAMKFIKKRKPHRYSRF